MSSVAASPLAKSLVLLSLATSSMSLGLSGLWRPRPSPSPRPIDFIVVAVDFTGAVPVSRASDLSLDNFLVCVSLDVSHIDDVVYDRLVDNGGVSDRSGAIIGTAPTISIADIVTRQIV